MKRHGPIRSARVVAVVATLALASGCSPVPAPATDGMIAVVASTNVYGAIAAAVGGESVTVTSIIDSPTQDPHSYVATARDQLAVSRADIVVRNGGGYDGFMNVLVEASGNDVAVVLDAAEISGLIHGSDDHDHDHGHHAGDGSNEHVWYSLQAMSALATELARRLAAVQPELDHEFEANAAAFTAGLAELDARLDALAREHSGEGVLMTEPVPYYLLAAAGLENRTPPEFTEAVEEGSDVAPRVLAETLDVLDDSGIALVVLNEQTAGAETEQVRIAAEKASVPVISVVETLPEGEDYLSWMRGNIDMLAAALSG